MSDRITDAERQTGPNVAAARVFAEYGDFIRSILYFRLRNRAQVDDLLQEFWLKLMVQPVPANVVNVKAYLYQTIINDTVDLMRRQEKHRHHMKKYAEETRIFIYNKPSQDAIEESEERYSRFALLVRQLRRREAQVITLRYRDNCTIVEIARQLGVHKRTVSRYLTSGMRELRRKLAVE